MAAGDNGTFSAGRQDGVMAAAGARETVGVRYRITAVLTRASNTHWQRDEASKLTDYCCNMRPTLPHTGPLVYASHSPVSCRSPVHRSLDIPDFH